MQVYLNCGDPMVTYTVEEYADAIIVRGRIPARTVGDLVRHAESRGLPYVDIELCQVLGATLVLVGEAGRARLRAKHGACIAPMPPLERWLYGCDTGNSSLAMAHAIFGTPLPQSNYPDRPHDPEDFGRCVRFLDAVPGARERLNAVSVAYPAWRPIVRKWAALEALYREEAPVGEFRRLYVRLQELLAEGDAL